MASYCFVPALICSAMLLTACTTTAYQSKDANGGYSERKLEENVYFVTFSGNSNTSRDAVYRSWLYRCADITTQRGYDWFVVLGQQAQSSKAADERIDVADLDSSKWSRTAGGYRAPIYIYSGGGGSVRSYSASAVIRLRRGDIEPGMKMAYVARDVMRDLGPEVTRMAANTPPSGRIYRPEDVFGGPSGSVNRTDSAGQARKVTLDDFKDLLDSDGQANKAMLDDFKDLLK